MTIIEGHAGTYFVSDEIEESSQQMLPLNTVKDSPDSSQQLAFCSVTGVIIDRTDGHIVDEQIGEWDELEE